MSDLYQEKIDILESLYPEVKGIDFYQYIFPNNECEGEFNTDYSKPNGIYMYQDEKDKGTDRRLRRRIMLDDRWEDDYCTYVENNPLTLCSGLSYRGRSNHLSKAQRMNALVFDLDSVGEMELRNLFLRIGKEPGPRRLPMPTFLVVSGTGLHLYYVFKEPIDLYPNIKVQLKALKYALTFVMWDYKGTSQEKNIQYQSINQGFRMVGSVNNKHRVVIRAFQTGDRVDLEYLNAYVKPEHRVDLKKPFKPTQMRLEEAREKYPEWYERVVVKKNRMQKKWDISGKVNGSDPYALYHWWLNKVDDILGGHRYFFLMCLAIYACKCDVPKKKLKKDMEKAFSVLLDVEHNNPFTKEDMRSALEMYDKSFYMFTLGDIEKVSGIRVERNKRNFRNQLEHIKRITLLRDNDYPDGEWRKNNGRPKGSKDKEQRKNKKEIVQEWRKKNPKGKKIDCEKETGLSRPTILKWWEL